MPEPDDEGEEHDKADGSKARYHNADYHHHQSGRFKSKAPTNPQEALKNVYKVKNGTRQLIGIDFENNQIVIFRHTGGNKYHGHIAKFSEFKDVAQTNLLKKLAKTDPRIAKMIK